MTKNDILVNIGNKKNKLMRFGTVGNFYQIGCFSEM